MRMNQDVRQCHYCRKLYGYRGSKLCPECIENMEKAEKDIRDYLRQNPGSEVATIAQDTDYDEKLILYLLKEGILTVDRGAATGSGLRCNMCGKPINSGQMCEECKASLGQSLNAASKSMQQKSMPQKNCADEDGRSKKGMHTDIWRRGQ